MDKISTGPSFAIADTSVTRIVEREGPWHNPYDMFPQATPDRVAAHHAELPDQFYDPTANVGKLCRYANPADPSAFFSGQTAGHVVKQGDSFGFKFLGD